MNLLDYIFNIQERGSLGNKVELGKYLGRCSVLQNNTFMINGIKCKDTLWSWHMRGQFEQPQGKGVLHGSIMGWGHSSGGEEKRHR